MKRTLLALSLVATASLAAVDVDALWNYADPAASESRFREALKEAKADDALILRTQVARTLGLRNRFEEARSELDGVEADERVAGRGCGRLCDDAKALEGGAMAGERLGDGEREGR